MKQGKDGWLRCEIERTTLRSLQQRSNTKGLVNLGLFTVPLVTIGVLAFLFRESAWAVPLFFAYGSIYGFSVSLLHETHHGTAFRSRRLNAAAHTLAGFMTLRNPIYDKYIHAQHHRKTSVCGQDTELSHPNPIVVWKLVLDLFWLRAAFSLPTLLVKQLLGIYSEDARKIIPPSQVPGIRHMAAAILAFYAVLVVASIVFESWLPLLFSFLAQIYGGLIPRLYALTQHLGLAQQVNDFRLNSRTCIYNPIAAAWYWNMNYHIEHHMYPNVPFHALPRLHEELRSQMPAPAASVIAAWKEIFGCIKRQQQCLAFSTPKRLPEHA